MSRETVSLKTFSSWDFSSDFHYEIDEDKRISKLWCKICSDHVQQIRCQARLRGISGQSLLSILSYVDGVEYIHKSNVARHVKSGSLHDWAKKRFTTDDNNNAITNTPQEVQTTTTNKPPTVIELIDSNAKAQYRNHFSTALSIVTKERPLSDMQHLVELQKTNGVQFVSGKSTDTACREFIKHIAMAVRQDVEEILKSANFLACEQDGSEARKTREEKELIYCKVVIRGSPVELLLKCQKMADFGGVNAEYTKAAIDEAFKTYNIDERKYLFCLVAACADGASVNMGRLSGALTCLKLEGRPWLLIIHCSAHRLELAVKDAFNKAADFEKVNDMMLNLHLFFKNSGKCWRILLLVAEKLGVILQRFPKSAGTRFQVHKYRALKVLIVNFLPLCLFAENMIAANNKACKPDQKAKLRGYLNQWLSYQYLASLHLYRLTLKETAHLSFTCQQSTSLVTDVISTLNSAEENLNSITTELDDFPFPVHIREDDTTVVTAASTNLPANQRFKDQNRLTDKQRTKTEKHVTVVKESYEIKRVQAGKVAVNRIKTELIPAIGTEITKRMESFNQPIYKASSIADYTQWDTDTLNYGIKEVKLIHSHFEESLKFHKFSLDMALTEWRHLKRLVKSKFNHFTNKIAMWQQVFMHHQQEFPHILLIIELALVTPYSSATVERGFSLMGRLLSNSRLSTSNKTLDDIMVIIINLRVLVKLDPTYKEKLLNKAVSLYLNDKHRRQSSVKKRSASVSVSDLRSSTEQSQDRYLPVAVSTVLNPNDLICVEKFMCTLSDEEYESDSMSVVSSSSDDSSSDLE